MNIEHCAAKICEIVGRGEDDRRSVMQLGYNLGRLAELTGRGREAFWDRWKDAVETWDVPRMRVLASKLGERDDRSEPIASNKLDNYLP